MSVESASRSVLERNSKRNSFPDVIADGLRLQFEGIDVAVLIVPLTRRRSETESGDNPKDPVELALRASYLSPMLQPSADEASSSLEGVLDHVAPVAPPSPTIQYVDDLLRITVLAGVNV